MDFCKRNCQKMNWLNFFPFLMLWLGCGLRCLTGEGTRPNIIFLLTDDQRDNTFAAMGHPWVKTPHFDRLLAQSVRFSNTYVAEPVCSPSRVSLFTGMHERVHGVGFTSSYQLTVQMVSANRERHAKKLIRKT